jgi:hypothetical protein
MWRSLRFLAALAASFAAAVALTDCISAPRPPVVATMSVGSVRVHDEQEITRDGLTLSVTPVTVDNFRRFPQAHRVVNWTRTAVVGQQVRQSQDSFDTNLFPMPAFQVRVSNHTGHVVRLTQSIFRLQDNLGRAHQIFTGTPELVAWNESIWSQATAAAPDVAAQTLPQVRAAVGQIQLMNRSIELLNGDEWSGFLVFNLGVNSNEEALRYLDEVNRLTLRIAEVPVELDDAGRPTRTAEFSYALDRTQGSIQVTCPPGTTVPSLSTCTW